MTKTDDEQLNIERAAMLCRDAAGLLPPNGPRRLQILLQMLEIEFNRYLVREVGARHSVEPRGSTQVDR